MHSLEKMFPSLTLFSDLDWATVTQEYEASYIDLSFPEYLQEKALDGDCPFYLFELAFYEMALNDAKTSTTPYPHQSGVHLNPTALFLSLEYDVVRMLKEAAQGKIDVHERNHVLCLYRDRHDQIHTLELDDSVLDLLQHLEEGPQPDTDFVSPEMKKQYDSLVEKSLIISCLK